MDSGRVMIWRAFAVYEPKNRPAERLKIALEMAREQGLPTERVVVSPATAEGTTAPAGVALVASGLVRRWEYRFELTGR